MGVWKVGAVLVAGAPLGPSGPLTHFPTAYAAQRDRRNQHRQTSAYGWWRLTSAAMHASVKPGGGFVGPSAPLHAVLQPSPAVSPVLQHAHTRLQPLRATPMDDMLDRSVDRILKKAARKQCLSHPSAAAAPAPRPVPSPGPATPTSSTDKKQPPKAASKAKPAAGKPSPPKKPSPTGSTSAAAPGRSAEGNAQELLDDDALLASITEAERDRVFDSIRLAVEGSGIDADAGWDTDDDAAAEPALPPRRRIAAASARDVLLEDSQPVASTSGGFKGFGTPTAARSPLPATAAATSPSATAPDGPSAPSTSAPATPPPARTAKQPLRVFL
jgi:hypothetical protein